MHRTVFLAALVIGVVLSGLSGCGTGPDTFPTSTFPRAELDAFVVDGLAPTHTFALDVVLDGPWLIGSIDASGLPERPVFTVRLEVENLQDEGIAPITVRVLDSESVVVVEHTLDPAADEAIANLDARAALADCVPDSPCEVALVVEVERAGDAGAMLARVSASGEVLGLSEDPIFTIALQPAP